MTTWPASRVSPPKLDARPGVKLIAGHGLAIPLESEGVALPEELYSRQLRDLDLDSEDAIAEFISRYGMLLDEDWLDLSRVSLVPWEWRSTMEYGDWTSSLPRLKQYTKETLSAMEERKARPEAIAAAAFRMNATVATQGLRRRASKRLQATHGIVHCDEVRIAAWQLRDMTRVFVEAAEGSDGSRAFDAWESRHWPKPATMEEALLDSACILNPALDLFHVRVEVYGAEHVVALSPVFDAYRVMCLQLFNDIVESTPWHTCENETCGRPFRRQIGRARYGQHRLEGKLLYCSPSCAAAHRARVRRAQITAASRLARQGLAPHQIAEHMSTSEDVVTAEQVRGWLAAAAKRRKGA